MPKTAPEKTSAPLMLWAATAADLMTPSPLSISENATVREVVTFLTEKGFSAAPVIDEAGRPVGVVSQADIVIHDREKVTRAAAKPQYYDIPDRAAPSGESIGDGFQVENVDRTRVSEIMTPTVYSVAPDTPARKVIEDMLNLKVHRLFVVGTDGVLVGVIGTLDVLRHLRPEPPPASTRKR